MHKQLIILAGALLLAFNASALLIGPGSASYVETDYSAYSNPDASDVEAITGCTDLTTLYKQDVGAGSDSGTFSGSYNTTFYREPSDPQDANIAYDGAPDAAIAPQAHCLWLLVKDGNHDPIWYLIDLSAAGIGWNGTDTLELRGFWPQQGAISHVTIFGGDRPSVPDGGTTLVLLGAALAGLGSLRRLIKR